MSGCGAERGLISIDEALDLVINKPKNLSSIQKTLTNSLSSYLAKEIYSEINLPSFSQSAVDGYALCSHTEDLNNQKFQVTGEIRAEARVMTYSVKVRRFVYLRAAKFLKGQRM